MESTSTPASNRWLTAYYLARATFSFAWVAAAVALGRADTMIAAVLLCVYPAWDAAANGVDAIKSGGLKRNPTQVINIVVSGVTTALVVMAVQRGPGAVLEIFGAWAIVAGILQLATAVRRWKTHAGQWPSILSGAQSALAGVFFIKQALAPSAPPIIAIAGYAGIGAVYFLVAGVWLAVKSAAPISRSNARPS